MPDAVFRFDSCYEWPEAGTRILVRADNEPDEQFYTRCVFGVRDFTNDGVDDIATWCRKDSVKTKKTTLAHTIYTVSAAGSEKRTVASKDARRLEMELCRQNPGTAQCK